MMHGTINIEVELTLTTCRQNLILSQHIKNSFRLKPKDSLPCRQEPPHLTLLWWKWSILPALKCGLARCRKNVGRGFLRTGWWGKYLSKRERGSERLLVKFAQWGSIMICTPCRVIELVRMKWVGVWHTWERQKCVQGFGGEPERKGPLWRPRPRLGNNIETGVKETGCDGVDCVYVAEDRDWWYSVVNTMMRLFCFVQAGYFLNRWATVSCTRSLLRRFWFMRVCMYVFIT